MMNVFSCLFLFLYIHEFFLFLRAWDLHWAGVSASHWSFFKGRHGVFGSLYGIWFRRFIHNKKTFDLPQGGGFIPD